MLPIWAKMDLGAVALKGYLPFAKLQNYWSLIVSYIRTLVGGGRSYSSAEMQLMYSMASADSVVWCSKALKHCKNNGSIWRDNSWGMFLVNFIQAEIFPDILKIIMTISFLICHIIPYIIVWGTIFEEQFVTSKIKGHSLHEMCF